MRILIADDDAVTAQLLSGLARSWGYEPLVTPDGLDALGVLKQDPTLELVVLDWMLPGLEGPDVCRQIREHRQDSPTYIVLLTSRRGREDAIAGIEAGADDYVAKPFDAKELRARLYAGTRVLALQRRLAAHVCELQQALAEVQRLSGLLPICAHCKSIRDDSNYWHQVEAYITERASVRFTHGICPKCMPTAEPLGRAGAA